MKYRPGPPISFMFLVLHYIWRNLSPMEGKWQIWNNPKQ